MKIKYFIITSGIIILAIIGVIISANANNTEIPELANVSSSSTIPKENIRPNKSLIGTWIKERTQQEDHEFPDDRNWQLTVTFDENGRFTWNSKRKNQDGKIIDESLTGTYTIERGFLISYHFDKPTKQALEKIPVLFAFWPNQMLGQQHFGFRDNYLSLSHSAAKIWISLKRKE